MRIHSLVNGGSVMNVGVGKRRAPPNGSYAAAMANASMTGLPGYELVERGVEDLAHHRVTRESLLLSRFSARFADAGMPLPASLEEPDRRLYELLVSVEGDAAHSAYNALTRRIVSFLRAAERAGSR
jgi:hypothetical protein